MLRIRERKSGNERCVYCHGEENDENSGLEMVDCLGCKASMHIQCRYEAKACATFGCNYRQPGAIKQFHADRDREIDWLELLDNETRSPVWRCVQCNERGQTFEMARHGVSVGLMCLECIRNGYVEIRYREIVAARPAVKTEPLRFVFFLPVVLFVAAWLGVLALVLAACASG